MTKVHDKFVIELAEVIKGYGNDPDVDDPFRLSEFYRFYELPEIAVSANHFKTMIPLEVVEKNAQPGWIPVTERLPEEDTEVLVTVYFMGLKQTSPIGWNDHIRPNYYVDLASRIGDDWSSASDEYKVARDRHKVVAWMEKPKPWEGGRNA